MSKNQHMGDAMSDSFWGRDTELLDLARIDKQKKAGLIVCLGRRRIGKSRLIQEFAKTIPDYLEIQGLGPRQGQTNQDQLWKQACAHFS
jgi:hypothetical protein